MTSLATARTCLGSISPEVRDTHSAWYFCHSIDPSIQAGFIFHALVFDPGDPGRPRAPSLFITNRPIVLILQWPEVELWPGLHARTGCASLPDKTTLTELEAILTSQICFGTSLFIHFGVKFTRGQNKERVSNEKCAKRESVALCKTCVLLKMRGWEPKSDADAENNF